MSSTRVLANVKEKGQSSLVKKSRKISEDVSRFSGFRLGLREKIRRTKSVPDELTSLETKKKTNGVEYFKKTDKEIKVKATRASSSAHVQYVLLRSVILDGDIGQLVGLIERKDVNISFMDPTGLYPMHYAAKSSNVAILEILVKAGADINVLSRNGEYPLDVAVKEGNFDVARYLIENGAKQKNIVHGMKGSRKVRAYSTALGDGKS